MKQAIARTRRRQGGWRSDLVQPQEQAGEQARLAAEHPRPSTYVGEHRWTFDLLEHERVGCDFQDARHRVSVAARMRHHEGFALGIAAGPKASEHSAAAEVVDLGGASGCDELHVRDDATRPLGGRARAASGGGRKTDD